MTTRKKKHNDDFFSHAKETMGEERYKKSLEKGVQTVNELRLKMAREELGLTQQNMEGLTQSEVSKIEKRKDVKASTLDKYAHAMKMKQVIVMRKDLNMRKGKMVAQGSHASVKVTVDNINNKDVQKWIAEDMRKICVSCDSEKELLELYQQAIAAKLPCSIIRDAGATEFKGVPTLTCIAIGPAEDSKVDAITKDLKLL